MHRQEYATAKTTARSWTTTGSETAGRSGPIHRSPRHFESRGREAIAASERASEPSRCLSGFSFDRFSLFVMLCTHAVTTHRGAAVLHDSTKMHRTTAQPKKPLRQPVLGQRTYQTENVAPTFFRRLSVINAYPNAECRDAPAGNLVPIGIASPRSTEADAFGNSSSAPMFTL